MPNIPESSTLNNPPRWLKEIRDDLQERPDTGNFFQHSHHMAELLVHEPFTEEKYGSGLELEHVSTATVAEKTLTQPQPKSIRIPRAKRLNTLPTERYILLKKYEGFVTARNGQSFMARLFENVNDYPVLEAEFDLEELSETDRTLVIEGAAVVWTIGYRYEGNARKRESVIYLRRLPPWENDEANHAQIEVDKLTRDIQWK